MKNLLFIILGIAWILVGIGIFGWYSENDPISKYPSYIRFPIGATLIVLYIFSLFPGVVLFAHGCTCHLPDPNEENEVK